MFLAIFIRHCQRLGVSWRSVVISRPARLQRDKFSLLIEQEQSARVPFEDIAIIVLNHREITLTHPVLSACGEYGISMFATGDTHHPNGVFPPYLQHSRATRMLRKQLAAPKPLIKQTWAAIIRQKIINQGLCLELTASAGGEQMASFALQVRSGDSTMMESQAAAFHFARLFGCKFGRSQLTWTNAALNYGYAILRGAIARGLVAHGFFPSIGLFHSSEQNAFNLADDIIEPFRPVIDLHVATHRSEDTADLLPIDKVELVALLNADIQMPRGTMSVLSAIEQSIESVARVLDQGHDKLLELPTLIGLDQHQREC